MNCPICHQPMNETLVCAKADAYSDCIYDEETCPERECFEPTNAGWCCENCGIEV